jgi:hypothetical protein
MAGLNLAYQRDLEKRVSRALDQMSLEMGTGNPVPPSAL